VDAPQVRYEKSGDVSIADQVVGDGSFDVVYVPGSFSNLELTRSTVRPDSYRLFLLASVPPSKQNSNQSPNVGGSAL
jgi:hypothetical protein